MVLLGFDTTALGNSEMKSFTITNSGTRAMSIFEVSTGVEEDFAVDLTGMLTSVPAAGSITFSVTFTPTVTGNRSDSLFIVTHLNEECVGNDSFAITLTGTGL